MIGTAKSALKGVAGLVLGLAVFVAFILVLVAILRGLDWFAATFLPIAFIASRWALLISLFILVPLAVFRATRGWSGLGFTIAGHIFGLLSWLLGFTITVQTLGTFWAIFGLFFAGIGVVPLALIATLWNGFWSLFWMLVMTIVLTVVAGGVGVSLIASASSRARPTLP